jgi:hypothetical protein
MSVADDRLTTQFVTLVLPCGLSLRNLAAAVEQELQGWGEPLRWAIVATGAQGIQVEAIVLTPQPIPPQEQPL